MNICRSLKKECIKTNVSLITKDEILNEIASLASSCKELQNHSKQEIYQQLKDREKIVSTGLEKGVAIPHCSFKDINNFVIGVITTKNNIEFSALDNKPSNIFIFIMGPEKQRNKHIKLLSTIAKTTSKESVINLLVKADSPSMINDIFESNVDFNESNESNIKEKSQLTFYVQNEEYFDSIIQLLSSNVEGSISVLEAESASRYLNRMPLFAAFWNSNDDKFCRIISCIMDKVAVNSTIRKLKEIIPNIDKNSGVLLCVQDVSYTIGSIDF